MIMSKTHAMSRRRLLGTAAGGLLLAPFLRQRALEAAATAPRRIVLMFSPDSNPPEWWPTEEGPLGFTLRPPLQDFEGLEDHMVFMRRLDHSWTYDNHHVAGIVQLFTGQRWVAQGSNQFANGPSIDQVLLEETDIRGGTARPSIHLGCDDGRTDERHIICYSGSGMPIANEIDPVRAFNDIFDGVTFGGMPEPMDQENPQAELDRALVELSMDEVRDVQRFLGQQEREKLDAHLGALEELKLRIDSSNVPVTPVGGSCEEVTPRTFGSRDLTNEANLREWAQLQADLIVNAFTCDRTRVASLSFSFSGGHHNGLLGYPGSWHDDVAHVSRTDDSISVGGRSMTTRAAFIEFSAFWASHFAYLAHRLAEIPEGDGTMLDNTLLVWGVESGTNHNHSPSDLQYLLLGGRNLGIRTGQFLQPGSTQSSNAMHTAILNAFGHPATGFGIEPNVGPLAGLLTS